MKRPKWASFDYRLCLVVLAFCLHAQAAEPSDVLLIQQAQVIVSDSATMPPEDAGWETVDLPHRVAKPLDRDLVGYWYKADFTVTDFTQPLSAYFPKLRSGGLIFVNGHEIGEIESANEKMQVRWFRPHLRYLPPAVLKRGVNQIAVHFAMREPLTSFGAFEIGPKSALRGPHDMMLFWERTSTDIATAICLLAGVFILIFWLRRPQEKLYGLFGVCVLFWGVRTFVFRVPEVPMAYWVEWRTIYYFTTGGFIACITIFLLKYSLAKNLLVTRFLLLYWIGGSLLFLLVGAPLRRFMDAAWMLGFLPFTGYAFIRLGHFAARVGSRSARAMVLAILLAIGLALHDYAVQHGMFHLNEFYVLHLGMPAYLLVMGSVLLERFVTSLQQTESMNEWLALRVADRERELLASHERLRLLERNHATTEERKRIMQDMHDGVGSQLLSTLVMVRRGGATQERMSNLLQECLDDMRLVIDSLSPDEPDLLPVLGNLRFRMEERFQDVGLELDWCNRDMPDSLVVAPHLGLQILRILQEALTNVLKHAAASKVIVDVAFRAEELQIAVEDNGVGFDGAERAGGRGLGNMRMRSSRIGASLTVQRLTPGTRVALNLPLVSLAPG